MKSKFSMIGNYGKSKTFYNRSSKQLSKMAVPNQRKTIYTESKQIYKQFQQNDYPTQEEESTFKQLKKQIKNLQNSQFLSLKYNAHSEQESVSYHYEAPQFRLTGKQFMSSKKVNNLERIKICLKKRIKAKKLNYLLDIKEILSHSNDHSNYNCLNSFILKSSEQQIIKQPFLKKRYVPNFLKNKCRRDEVERSDGQTKESSNAIRGRRVLRSKANQSDKQNILICCY